MSKASKQVLKDIKSFTLLSYSSYNYLHNKSEKNTVARGKQFTRFISPCYFVKLGFYLQCLKFRQHNLSDQNGWQFLKYVLQSVT